MSQSIGRVDIFWGYGAQALNIGSGLLLLPAILVTLTPADVGIWFVFIALGGFAQLLELGFQPTIARNATYVFTGATCLQKEGVPNNCNPTDNVSITLLAELISCSRQIYRWIALFSAVSLLGGGSIYIYSVLHETQNKSATIVSWVLFSSGYIFTFYFGYINAILQGRGDISKSNKIIVITRTSLIVAGILFLTLDFGLLGLGSASLLSAAIGRVVAIKYMRQDSLTKKACMIFPKSQNNQLLAIMWHNAKRMAAVQLSAFIIQRANILIGTSFLGTVVVASYSMTLTVLMALSSMSSAICQVQLPYLSSLQLLDNKRKIRFLYTQLVTISISLYIIGGILIGLLGNSVLTLIGSKVGLLSMPLYWIFAVIVLLEMHHAIAATYITTQNSVPFVRAATISATLTLVLSIVLIRPFEVLGLILAQGVTQLLYNNWKWPLVVYKNLYKVN
ncbi:MAG: O-unit flippase-like protein [Rhodoferax sp.]